MGNIRKWARFLELLRATPLSMVSLESTNQAESNETTLGTLGPKGTKLGLGPWGLVLGPSNFTVM